MKTTATRQPAAKAAIIILLVFTGLICVSWMKGPVKPGAQPIAGKTTGAKPSLSVSIFAVQAECGYGQAYETISGGTPPYTINWEISINSGSYQPFNAPIFFINCQTDTYANFHCTVTDAASATADAYYHLEIGANYPLRVTPVKPGKARKPLAMKRM